MKKEMEERRKYKRIKISKVGAEYRLVDFNFWAEFRSHGTRLLKDISLGGMCFITQDPMPLESLMSLSLKIGDAVKIEDIYGRVVRIRELENKEYEIGINFSWWDREEDKKSLVSLLENTTSSK